MDEAQAMVDEFHERFGLARPMHRVPLNAFDAMLRIRLMREELAEFESAFDIGDSVEMIDALCDLLYVTYGTGVALGVDLEPHFKEVHEANMRKLGPDGKPLLRSDGKLLKPDDWTGPDHERILEAGLPYLRAKRVPGAGDASVRRELLAAQHEVRVLTESLHRERKAYDREISRLRDALHAAELANLAEPASKPATKGEVVSG